MKIQNLREYPLLGHGIFRFNLFIQQTRVEGCWPCSYSGIVFSSFMGNRHMVQLNSKGCKKIIARLLEYYFSGAVAARSRGSYISRISSCS